MPGRKKMERREQALLVQEQRYRLKAAELARVGFILQGSVTERWKQCGKRGCLCQTDEKARHGPYYQWSWKSGGRTYSVHLTEDQAAVCRKWIRNNRCLENHIKQMRALSLRAARLFEINRKP